MLIFEEMCVNLHPNWNLFRLMRQIKTICLLLMAAFAVTSCLKSKEDNTTKYADAAITSFSLGTLNRYVHTTSKSGADSVYRKTLAGASYVFHIDHVQQLIYNTDSLPVDADLKHVLCSVTTKNNGTLVIKDVASDTLRYYSSADSIDFTEPRIFMVWSNDGEGFKEYKVCVNKHKEKENQFVWHQMASSDKLVPLSNLHAYYYEGEIYLTGDNGDVSETYHVDKDGKLTAYDSSSSRLPDGIKKWIGTTSEEIYALSNDNRLMVSRDDGKTWEEDMLDEDASMLPVRDIAFVSYPLYYATNTEYALMVGNRSVEQYPQERIAMVWRKIVDNDPYTPEGIWTYMERSDYNQLALPRLENLSLVAYDDAILAIGGADITPGVVSSRYAQFYVSRDDGITWKQNSSYTFPDGFNTDTNSVAMIADDEYNLWLFCGTTGQIWRGRLNKLAWEYVYE